MKNFKELESDFTELIENNKKLIYKVANTYCRDFEERKDIVQEIILQLWKAFPKYDNKFAETTWIYRIAFNVSISLLRKETSRKKTLDEYHRQLEFMHIEDETIEDENLKLLHKFIEELKPIDKALIILYLDGCKNKEIADVMGISESNVSTKIYRIKESLIRHFKNIKQ